MTSNKNFKKSEPHYLIIPAAGLGTRMREVNPDIPKEMLPIGNKPAIQYAVEEGISAGIKNIIIIISKQKEIIRQYFEDKTSIEKIRQVCSLTFLYQKKPLGESDAISYAKNIVGSHSVGIINPDNIYFPAPGILNVLKSIYCRYKTDVIALVDVKRENAAGLSNAGRVDIEPANDHIYRIKKFYQKGKGHFVPRFKGELRSCAMSISGPHIFEFIEKLRDTIKAKEFTNTPVHCLTLKEKGFLGCHFQGTFFDIGNPIGYEQCLEYIQKNIHNHTNVSVHQSPEPHGSGVGRIYRKNRSV